MGIRTRSALALGTALALLWMHGVSFAQTVPEQTEADAEAQQPATTADGSTLLQRIDVGAGAEGTAGTDVIAVTPEEMDRKKPADLSEIFAGEPEVAVGGAIPSTQKIYVHGVDENNLAVTVDGSRQNNKVFHHNGTYLIDPELLKAVNVQAGVAPADAGPGALGGSIGFETKDAADLLEPGRMHGGFVTGGWDTNSETYTTGAAAFGRVGGFEYLGYLNYSNGGNFTSGGGQEMGGTGTNLLGGLAKLAYESETGHRFELSHEHVSDDEMRPYRANVYIEIGEEPPLRRYDLDRHNTVFTYTTTLPTEWWDPKVVLAYSRTRVATPFYNRRLPGGFLADAIGATSSFNGKAENKFSFDLGTVTAGFDFFADRAKLDYTSSPPEITEEKALNVGAYMQARLEPTDLFRIAFGVRGDNHTFTGVDGSEWNTSGLSGNLSGEYDIIPDWLTAKAGVAHVFGGIPLAENFIQDATWTYGGPSVPVTSDNFTAGLELERNGFMAEVGVFQTNVDNARLPDSDLVVADPFNRFDLRTWGWHAGVGYDWGDGFVKVKYTNTESEVNNYHADSDVGRYLTTPLGQIFMVSAGYVLPEWGVRLGADAEIALPYNGTLAPDTRYGDDKVALKGYEVVNAYVEYVPPSRQNITLRADVKNIFDQEYTNRAAYGQDFDGVKPHLDPGRSFRFSATVKF